MNRLQQCARPSPYPRVQTLEDLQQQLTQVRHRIADACARVERLPSSVRLLPVSKTIDDTKMRLAYQAGCREFGENRVQEAWRKRQAMDDLADLKWTIIGHLQTNKAKVVAQFASEFQALDSHRLAVALERRLQAQGRGLDVYVQVNTSGEASKYGVPLEEAVRFVASLGAYSSLQVRGLMTLAMLSSDVARVRPCFAALRQLRAKIRQELANGDKVSELSMGMSGDFETAIEEGATVVRVGQAIFGARTLPDSHFWPSSLPQTHQQ